MPDASGLTSLGEALTGKAAFSAEPVPLSLAPFRELSGCLQAAVKQASAEELMDAGARWAQLLPWKPLGSVETYRLMFATKSRPSHSAF